VLRPTAVTAVVSVAAVVFDEPEFDEVVLEVVEVESTLDDGAVEAVCADAAPDSSATATQSSTAVMGFLIRT
jgi:hypothetical protein